MALNTDSMVMPVTPTGFGGFGGGDDIWVLLIIMFALFGNGGFGWGGGNGGSLGGAMYPWMNLQDTTQAGFNQASTASQLSGIQSAITSGFGDTALGIAGINQNICQSGNATVAAVTGAQNSLAQQMYSNQIADLERSFAAQTANTQGLTNLQSELSNCCCANRLATVETQNVVQSEGAATRLAIQNQTQEILDKMCQQEIDALKAQNIALQNQVNMQNLAASQAAQTAQLIADNTAQTQYLVNRISPYPIPSYTVPNPFGTVTAYIGG